jgi:hypothetical protein
MPTWGRVTFRGGKRFSQTPAGQYAYPRVLLLFVSHHHKRPTTSTPVHNLTSLNGSLGGSMYWREITFSVRACRLDIRLRTE